MRVQKNQRINIAFYDENLEYLQLISRVKGVSITQHINNLIQEDKKNNEAVLIEAKKLFNLN